MNNSYIKYGTNHYLVTAINVEGVDSGYIYVLINVLNRKNSPGSLLIRLDNSKCNFEHCKSLISNAIERLQNAQNVDLSFLEKNLKESVRKVTGRKMNGHILEMTTLNMYEGKYRY